MLGKVLGNSQPTIRSIQSKDSHTEDPNEIENAFYEIFFVNIASKIKEPVENTSHEKLIEFVDRNFLLTPNLLSLILKRRRF